MWRQSKPHFYYCSSLGDYDLTSSWSAKGVDEGRGRLEATKSHFLAKVAQPGNAPVRLASLTAVCIASTVWLVWARYTTTALGCLRCRRWGLPGAGQGIRQTPSTPGGEKKPLAVSCFECPTSSYPVLPCPTLSPPPSYPPPPHGSLKSQQVHNWQQSAQDWVATFQVGS